MQEPRHTSALKTTAGDRTGKKGFGLKMVQFGFSVEPVWSPKIEAEDKAICQRLAPDTVGLNGSSQFVKK